MGGHKGAKRREGVLGGWARGGGFEGWSKRLPLRKIGIHFDVGLRHQKALEGPRPRASIAKPANVPERSVAERRE